MVRLFLVFKYIAALMLAAALLAGVPSGSAQAQTGQRCFTETNLCIEGRIREFWEQNGGLTVFGLPITAQESSTIEGKTLQVQWFQRNRLELHPENARPYDVLLGRLGADRLAQQGRDPFTFPKSGAQPGCRFFPETGHNVCSDILKAWHANGLEFDGKKGKSEAENLALFGLPLNDAATETLSDGKQYVVQFFERGRFELHPENAAPYNVLLGLLGTEVRDGSAAPTTPTPTANDCPDVPDPVNATLVESNKCIKPGESLRMILVGFKPNEPIAFWINLPDGSIFGTPGQIKIKHDGVLGYRTNPISVELDPGVYSFVFRGVDSGHEAVVYFKILKP